MPEIQLSESLKKAQRRIEWYIVHRCQLQPFFTRPDGSKSRVVFEECDWKQLYEIAAFSGFPIRYPHYHFAISYHEYVKGHEFGLSKIYEMVINNDPVYAYLLKGNSLTDDQLVMAHVYAHADFFVNNLYFANTNRKALDMMANHAVKISRFCDYFGNEEVEKWIDICLSLDNLIDVHSPPIKREEFVPKDDLGDNENGEDKNKGKWNGRFEASDYMDTFINPVEELKKHREKQKKENEEKQKIKETGLVLPAAPTKDIMAFLAKFAPLKRWQREVLLTIRDEAYYFVPQAQTKIMNEGWAAFWHSRVMTTLLKDSEIIDYADHNSGTLRIGQGRLNPYALGKAIWLGIVYCWDTHRHSKIYRECNDEVILSHWDQFVAYKNIYEEYRNFPRLINRHWEEFLCFWEAVTNCQFGISLDIYRPELLLRWWYFYQTVDQQLRELQKEVDKWQGELVEHESKLKDFDNYDWEEKEKLIAAIKFLKQDFLPQFKGVRTILDNLSAIKVAFARGRLKPNKFFLPVSFTEYAENCARGTLPIGVGMAKIFEVRRTHCDLTFIDEFLTPEICQQQKLFNFSEDDHGYYFVTDHDCQLIKRNLLDQLTNIGNPQIFLDTNGANFNNAQELTLTHIFTDKGLDLKWTKATLKNLFKVWQRPVHIETQMLVETVKKNSGEVVSSEWKPVRVSFGGKKIEITEINEDDKKNGA